LINKLFFFAALCAVSPLNAAFSPGRYEIQNAGGRPLGVLTVSIEEVIFEKNPATRVTWAFDYSRSQKGFTEKHEAYTGKNGLVYFRRETSDGEKTAVTEGRAKGTDFEISLAMGKRMVTTAVPLKGFQISEYFLDTPLSPFWDMKVNDAQNATILPVRQSTVVDGRRNINMQASYKVSKKKDVPVYVASTNLGTSVVTTWYTIDGHVVMRENWPDRQFIRIEK
jgi:hypothetical protein